MTKATYKQIVADGLEELLTKVHEQERKDSGWIIEALNYLNLDFYVVKPVRGSSWIPTPATYSNSRCGLINVKDDDQECFRWCMKYHQSSQQKDAQNISALKKVDDKYDYSDITFPTSYDDIYKFEERNNLCIFVYEIGEDGSIHKAKTRTL